MEMVETQNQNPTTMRVRYNNPGYLKICEVGEELWRSRNAEWLRQICVDPERAPQLTRNRLLTLLSTQFFAASSPAFSASS
jgi:hypothetical protein